LLNDPLIVEQAAVWAQRTVAGDEADNARIRRLYLEAFARQPTETEMTAAISFLDQQATEHAVSTDARRSDARPWADLCHVLFNCKEFIFVE
jgi:hypothetical protein